MMYERTRLRGVNHRPARTLQYLAAIIAAVSVAVVLVFLLHRAIYALDSPLVQISDPAAPPSMPQRAQRYPPGSGLLTSDMREKLFPGARYERFLPIAHAASTMRAALPSEIGVEYLFTADRYHVIGRTPVQLLLEVRGKPGIEVHVRSAWAEAVGARGRVGTPVPVTFSGQGGRRVASFTPEDSMPGHQGMIDLVVQFTVGPPAGGTEEAYQSRLPVLYTGEADIPASFTGQFRYGVVDGWLCLWVGVDVVKPGRYVIDANLFSAHGSAGAWINFKGELPAGVIEVPLPVSGGLVRDAKMIVPFALRNLRGSLQEAFGVTMRSHDGDFAIDVLLDELSLGPWAGEERPPSCRITS